MVEGTSTPLVGRYGRRPAKQAPALRLASFLTGTVPKHPDAVDHGARMTNWKMLGNDAAGDCAAVCWANERRAVSTALGKAGYPTQAMVWKVYRSQNPGFRPGNGPHGYGSDDDQGMVMQTLAEYLHKTGGADGVKSVAFAQVDITQREELEAAVAIFGGVSWGVTVTRANEDAFTAGKPWDWKPKSPVVGRHAVYGLGYTAADDERFITWATPTRFTERFRQHQVDEAWVTIWPEHLGSKSFQAGVDLAALTKAYKTLTGKDLVIPPKPKPPAKPDAADQALWKTTASWRKAPHTDPTVVKMIKALGDWGKAKGLK